MVTREDIIAAFPIAAAMEKDGMKLIGAGTRKMALCAFHQERTPSLSVNIETGLFFCFGCRVGGSVIDYIAKKTGRPTGDVFKELAGQLERDGNTTPAIGTPTATYVYRNQLGEEVFRVLKFIGADGKKTFRQQRRENKLWSWGMEGVQRVLYRLPEILTAKNAPVAIAEGEKDADNLVRFGFNATTNVGGAGKWMEGYAEYLANRDVILFGDNDEPGQNHVKKVIELLDGKVRSIRSVVIPPPYKDVSEFLTQFGAIDAGSEALEALIARAPVLVAGATVPLLSMVEMEDRYREVMVNTAGRSYSFASWLPTFGFRLRPSVPGDIICFVAATGIGKTALLQNMAYKAAPTPTVLFEMELSDSVTFERFCSMVTGVTQDDVAAQYKAGYTPPWRDTRALDNVFTCPLSGISVLDIEKIVNRAELKMGSRPLLVMVDYVQLVRGLGKTRYEQMTSAMSDLKSMAKNTGTIVVVTSQVARTVGKESSEIGLESGKDSGQVETSSGLHIGVWRDKQDDKCLWMSVNKNTRGRAGWKIPCNFDGPTMRITERTVSPSAP